METLQSNEYRELHDRKADFQNILHLLVQFDERTKRHLRFPDASSHYTRKAIALSDANNLRILLKPVGEYVYSVIIQAETESGLVVSAYVHEDGIRKEREETRDRDHPVHKIVCLTDLYEVSQTIQDYSGLSSFAVKLLDENRLQ